MAFSIFSSNFNRAYCKQTVKILINNTALSGICTDSREQSLLEDVINTETKFHKAHTSLLSALLDKKNMVGLVIEWHSNVFK